MPTVNRDTRSTQVFDGPYYLSIAGELVETDVGLEP